MTPEGLYVTSVQTDGARFNTVLGALLGTRLALCFQALACTKVSLIIRGPAILYKLLQHRQSSVFPTWLCLKGVIHAATHDFLTATICREKSSTARFLPTRQFVADNCRRV